MFCTINQYNCWHSCSPRAFWRHSRIYGNSLVFLESFQCFYALDLKKTFVSSQRISSVRLAMITAQCQILMHRAWKQCIYEEPIDTASNLNLKKNTSLSWPLNFNRSTYINSREKDYDNRVFSKLRNTLSVFGDCHVMPVVVVLSGKQTQWWKKF